MDFPLWPLCLWSVACLGVILCGADCPNSCYCNEDYVSCVGDGLMPLPNGHLPTTIRLDFRNYHNPMLSKPQLKGLDILQELKLQQLGIRHLEDGVFEYLRRLQRLDLSQNDLQNISGDVFHCLDDLRYLDISGNALTDVEGYFVHLKNLEHLILSENKLTIISARTFYGINKVQHLNLDSNSISNIEVGAFQYLSNLDHLILSHNPLATLSRLDFFGKRLQFIDISWIGLQSIPQSLTKFVRDFRIGKNNLTKIGSGDFESFPYLSSLELDDNGIDDIEDDALGRLDYLSKLSISKNKLSAVPENLPANLKELNLMDNLLTNLTKYSFQGLFKLEVLQLRNNWISFLDACAFCDIINLKTLDLTNNRIENLTDTIFGKLEQLESLHLSQNEIMFFGAQSFSGLTNLAALYLTNLAHDVSIGKNAFDTLPQLQALDLYGSPLLAAAILNSTHLLNRLKNLRQLNIMNNGIQRIRSDLPKFFPKLKILKMSHNSWHCDRAILTITNWMKYTTLIFTQRNLLLCHSPRNFSQKSIALLKLEHFEIPAAASNSSKSPESISQEEHHTQKEVIPRNQTIAKQVSLLENTSTPQIQNLSLESRPIMSAILRNFTVATTRQTFLNQISNQTTDSVKILNTSITFKSLVTENVSEASITDVTELSLPENITDPKSIPIMLSPLQIHLNVTGSPLRYPNITEIVPNNTIPTIPASAPITSSKQIKETH